MNNTLLSVLLACIVLIQCKSIEQPESKADSTVSEVTLPTSPNQVNQSVTSDVITPLAPRDPYQEFLSRKDAISIEKLIKNKKAKSSVDQGAFSMGEQLILFSFLAQSGNQEVEQWLLDFFDEYIDALIIWNNTCDYCDGVGGVPHMFKDRFDFRLSKALDNIPPSKEKIDLIMRLYNQEPDTYAGEGDHDPVINGNERVLISLRGNVPKSLRPKRRYVGLYNKEVELYLQEVIEHLYNQIKMGEAELIDRETWKEIYLKVGNK